MKIYLKSFFFIYLIIFLFLNYKSSLNNYFFSKSFIKNLKIKRFLIEVDIYSDKGGRGPDKFIEGLNEILPYRTNNCIFFPSLYLNIINGNNNSDFLFLPFPRFDEKTYNECIKINKVNKLILGPIFVPNFWYNFPDKDIWKEKRFQEIIKEVKGIGVHSNRVKEYLAHKSNTTNMLQKFIVIRPCTNLIPKFIKPFKNRKFDILFFEKYQDLNRRKQGNELLELLQKYSQNVIRIEYGFYSKKLIQKLANNCKFIIYFSFFDTGAIGLKEIQNFGVYAFSHQKELIIHKDTGFFVPELSNEFNISLAYNIIINKIDNLKKLNINSKLIAKINQEINNCQNSLDDLCKGLL